jgi:hypothetical protein
VLKRVLGYVQRPQSSAIGAVVRNDHPIRYWFTIGNQQVRTELTKYTTKAEPEPTKTYQLNRKNQIDRTNKFTELDIAFGIRALWCWYSVPLTQYMWSYEDVSILLQLAPRENRGYGPIMRNRFPRYRMRTTTTMMLTNARFVIIRKI